MKHRHLTPYEQRKLMAVYKRIRREEMNLVWVPDPVWKPLSNLLKSFCEKCRKAAGG